jgi:hypothetical protein
MKRIVILLTLTLLFAASVAQASNVGVDINIHAGAPVAPPPPPVYAPPSPVYVPSQPQIVIQQPPVFLAPPELGFYVAVDIPYDMVYISGRYYLYNNGGWYRGRNYNGPWIVVPERKLPPGLRKYRYEEVRHYRDVEYSHYHQDRDHYRGEYFRPDKGGKKHRKEDKERWKEEKRWEKEERKQKKHDD